MQQARRLALAYSSLHWISSLWLTQATVFAKQVKLQLMFTNRFENRSINFDFRQNTTIKILLLRLTLNKVNIFVCPLKNAADKFAAAQICHLAFRV
jgi:hypothetical protein